MRSPVLTATLLFALACPASAETPNLSANPVGRPGPAAQLVAAEQAYKIALQSGDPLLIITAIRLARDVTLRPATGWTRVTENAPSAEPAGDTLAEGPAGARAISIARGLAGDDPALQDLVYDLDAQLPHGRRPVAITATGVLEGGQTDTWRMVLAGEIPAEIGLIGGAARLGLRIQDEAGRLVCARPPATDPSLCRFTPAGNGFFTVEVTNPGTVSTGYRLVGN